MTTALGLDIGGANLKIADLDGRARSVAFPMWERHRDLAAELCALTWHDEPDLIGLTMTGELADCFSSKHEGVCWIIDSVTQAFPDAAVRVWLTTGEFAEPDDAFELPELVAAANWHALATWAGRAIPSGAGLLIDAGSTTTDIIPLRDGLPATNGLTDMERLQSGELVYSGVRRTPVCAVSSSVEVQGTITPLAAEVFATMGDVHVCLGSLAEDPDDTNTADGGPATVSASQRRIARMVCCDADQVGGASIAAIAQQIANAQKQQLTAAVRQVLEASLFRAGEVPTIVSGSGLFMAEEIVRSMSLKPWLNLHQSSTPEIAESACAFALARLVFERCRDDLLQVVSL